MPNEIPSKTPYKILIVEDEAPLCQILVDAFTAEGFSVQRAGDGEEGLSRAISWQPDIILLDIVMPKMDGMTMLHKLREAPEGKDTPVILLTNLSDTAKVYDALTNNVFDFLVKANWTIDGIIKVVKSKLTPKA